MTSGVATWPDLLRLLVVPVFGWAAWRDLRTRRVPNAAWLPLGALGVALLAFGAWTHLPVDGFDDYIFLLRSALSVGIVVPLAYGFWRIGGFGGADAKALMVLGVLLPVYPTYRLGGVAMPLERTRIGVFAMTVLTNAVLVGMAYPAYLGVRNALAGERSPAMFFARRVPTASLSERHGSLFETREGFTRHGLDLDALRMYLRWRGASLEALRADPERFRDPRSVGETRPPGDGAVDDDRQVATDGGQRDATDGESDPAPGDAAVDPAPTDGTGPPHPEPPTDDDPTEMDPWAAARFLDEIEGSAYGTTAEGLREGLATVSEREEVWVSPGIPFLVPVFVGLVAAFTYGDLLFGLLRAAGLV